MNYVETAEILQALDLPTEVFAFDLAIVRGLDYYTGVVFETFLLEHPEFGQLVQWWQICKFVRAAWRLLGRNFRELACPLALSRLFDQAMRHGLISSHTQESSTKILICFACKETPKKLS